MTEGFIQRELDRIQRAIFDNHPERDRLMVAQQALVWALDPNTCYASPFAMVTGERDERPQAPAPLGSTPLHPALDA